MQKTPPKIVETVLNTILTHKICAKSRFTDKKGCFLRLKTLERFLTEIILSIDSNNIELYSKMFLNIHLR
nr:MAG TPA: hypothetical protein [Caudoviricetes sp.]